MEEKKPGRVEEKGLKEYDLYATRTKVKRERNSISRNVSLMV